MRIYTKTGDKGTTSLASGERVSKTDLRIETYGTADELNAFFGLLQAKLADTEGGGQYAAQILLIQNKLFNLGALLSDAPGEWITADDVEQLELQIDRIQAELPPQRAFILPAGSELTALAHVCRTVTRRLERLMVRLAQTIENTPAQTIDEAPVQTTGQDIRIPLKWVNRLSDFCFVLARECDILQKKAPIEWKK